MKGSIFFEKDRGRWAVSWRYEGRTYMIRRYKGEYMFDESIARKCLSLIQNRWEEHLDGVSQFRIEEFTAKGWTDVTEFYERWIEDVIRPTKKPATYKGYRSYLKNWIRPFFEKHPVRLHEIQLNTLHKFMQFINLTGKGKLNVVMALRSCMDYALRSRRIREIPPFPKLEDYGIVEPRFDWLWEAKQMEVINAIPEAYRPPFLWLKHHYRRPGEACALFKTDYDVINNAFWIRRTISARQMTDRTKTGAVHYMPCHKDFTRVARRLLNENLDSPFMFVNPRSRRREDGGRYTLESLNTAWRQACRAVGVDIRLYHGTKHSSCTQFINEKGGSDGELQILTDHARIDSVKKYREVGLIRKRELIDREIIYDGYSKPTPKRTSTFAKPDK
jgi:integrase